jgi:hypothetical protein
MSNDNVELPVYDLESIRKCLNLCRQRQLPYMQTPWFTFRGSDIAWMPIRFQRRFLGWLSRCETISTTDFDLYMLVANARLSD